MRDVTRGLMGLIGVLIAMGMQGTMLHAATQPPAGAVTAELGFPSVGTTWVYKVWARGPMHSTDQGSKRTLHEGTVFTKYHTVMEESTRDGHPVHRVRDGQMIHLTDKVTGNATGIVREHKEFTSDKTTDEVVTTVSEGEALFSFSPYIKAYDFPLWVGKSWEALYVFYNHKEEKGTTKVWRGKVSAYEEVTVPAGTFKTFKVEGADETFQLVQWYAPKLHIVVKAIFEQEFETRISELTQYVAK